MSNTDLQQHVAMLKRELHWARLKIQALQEELRQERIKKYGPQSETLSALQLELLESEPGVTGEEVEAEAKREPLPRTDRERKPHPGRQSLPKDLPRIEQVVACTDRSCKQCGAETTLIGYDESEQLDVEPARFFVRVVRREKRSCRGCGSNGVITPELAPRIIEKKDWRAIGWWWKRWWPSIAITCRCTGRRRYWSAKQVWKSAVPRWMAG